MDEISDYNRERWNELSEAGVTFSRPMLDLTPETARARLDPYGCMGDVAGRDVLCLASGGGQQSAAFGVLGARVTVLDLCDAQLERDREAAARYGLDTVTCQGDMRDLGRFADGSFDLVYHAHSLSFVPGTQEVFSEVRRVLRTAGLYRLSYSNPFVHAMFETRWCGGGYAVCGPYVDGAEVPYADS